jgi:hypothetical protein
LQQQQKETTEMATTTTARKPWTPAQTKRLKALINKGQRAKQIANTLKRTPGAINQKINSLGWELKSTGHGRRTGTPTNRRRSSKARHS